MNAEVEVAGVAVGGDLAEVKGDGDGGDHLGGKGGEGVGELEGVVGELEAGLFATGDDLAADEGDGGFGGVVELELPVVLGGTCWKEDVGEEAVCANGIAAVDEVELELFAAGDGGDGGVDVGGDGEGDGEGGLAGLVGLEEFKGGGVGGGGGDAGNGDLEGLGSAGTQAISANEGDVFPSNSLISPNLV